MINVPAAAHALDQKRYYTHHVVTGVIPDDADVVEVTIASATLTLPATALPGKEVTITANAGDSNNVTVAANAAVSPAQTALPTGGTAVLAHFSRTYTMQADGLTWSPQAVA